MMWMRTGLAAAAIAMGSIVGGCGLVAPHAPEKVFLAPLGPYGEADNYPADSELTDGNSILEIVRGPVRILSITFRDTGVKPEILGIMIRPLSPTVIPFDKARNYPPDDPSEWRGAIVADGATLRGPAAGTAHADFELLVGYRMPDSGHYGRRAVVIKYEYAGRTATLIHPSWIDLCVGTKNSPPCPSDAGSPGAGG
jgi:hypothetical protein